MIPIYDDLTTSVLTKGNKSIIDYEEISEKLARTGDFFALKMKGDSMEPMIENGDIVIVKQTAKAKTGDIVIALLNSGNPTCKRLVRHASGIRLISQNPAYEPILFSNEEFGSKSVCIVGKVMEIRKKFY